MLSWLQQAQSGSPSIGLAQELGIAPAGLWLHPALAINICNI